MSHRLTAVKIGRDSAGWRRRSAPCRDHHGRQWPLGEGPRPAAHRRPPPGRRGGAPHRDRAAAELGVAYLTLFGFSSENWKRPAAEVDDLMGLLRHYLRSEIAELHRNGVRLRVIGDRDAAVRRHRRADRGRRGADRAATRALNLTVALSYGGRAEIVAAPRAPRAKPCAPARSTRGRSTRTLFAAPSVHRRHARSRPADPHQRRAAHQQFPAVAVRLCRAGLHRHAVAGLRERGPRSRRSPSSAAASGATAPAG